MWGGLRGVNATKISFVSLANDLFFFLTAPFVTHSKEQASKVK
jgi:hypothetical protein